VTEPRRRLHLSPPLIEGLIIAALLLLPLLFWWQLWLPEPADRATIPEGDLSSQYYPLQLFAARELAAGRIPAWDPYLNAGQPGLADIQTGFYYPLNLLANLVLALLGWPFSMAALTGQIIFHFSLASLFTYLFVRHLARRAGARAPAARFAGAVAALSFTYAGYLTSFPVQQITILETAVWLPLVLLFLDRAFYSRQPWPQLILAALALACALLAGHPQTAMYVVYAALAYSVGLSFLSSPASPAFRSRLGSLLILLLALVLGAALATAQLVPTLQFIARSSRAGLGYEDVSWGFPLAEMTHLLYPGYFGGSPQYVGILPLILAAAAWFVRRARREVAFWSGVAVLALLLSFGGHTFLYNLAHLALPGFGLVRDQERIIYLFSFALSVLAGYGALTLVQPLPAEDGDGFRRFWRGLAWVGVFMLGLTALFYYGYLQGEQQGVEINLFAGLLRHHVLLLFILAGSVLLFGLRLAGRLRRGWLVALALALIWLNLFTINWRYNQVQAGGGEPFPETGLVRFLQEQPTTGRISSAGLLPGGASAAVVYELEDITANTPLRMASFQRFEDQMGSWRRWQLLNVHHVLSRRDLDGPGMERVYEEGKVKVYRIGDPLPRAWLVHSTLIAGDAEALRLLDSQDLDPRATAVLPPEVAALALPGAASGGGSARVMEALPGRLTLEVTASGEGLLVVSQPYYPGWRAWVDDQEVTLVRADYLLQALPLQSGQHRVELRYCLPLWPALVSLLVLAGCLVGLVPRGKAQA